MGRYNNRLTGRLIKVYPSTYKNLKDISFQTGKPMSAIVAEWEKSTEWLTNIRYNIRELMKPTKK